MTEKKKTSKQSPDNLSPRPEELLLASMNREDTADEPSSTAEEDDPLAAMLRSALGGSDRRTETVSLDLDTSEFEIEEETEDTEEIVEEIPEEIVEEMIEEIPEETVEEIIEEIPEEIVEEIIEEIPEEIVEEIIEEIPEEIPEEIIEEIPEEIVEEISEEIVEEIPEEISEEIVEEIIGEIPEEITEEIVEETTGESEDKTGDDCLVEIAEELFVEVIEEIREGDSTSEADEHSAKGSHAEAGEEEIPDAAQIVCGASPSAVTSEEKPSTCPTPTVRPLADDRLNGTSPAETMGGSRLARLNRENERLLNESRMAIPTDRNEDSGKATAAAETFGKGEVKENEGRSAPSDKAASHTEFSGRVKPVRDPLQLGLDDVLSGAPSEKGSVSCRPTPVQAGYTAHMGESAPKERVLEDTDIHLGLGHETDLDTKTASDRVEALREKAASEAIHGRGDAVVTNRGREYRGNIEADAVTVAYGRARRAAVLRLCIAAAGTLLGILYDLFGVLTLPMSMATFANTPLYALFGVLWMMAVSILFIPRLWQGIKSLWDFEPTRYSVSALALPVALLQGIWSIFKASPYLFCGVALLTLTLSALSEVIAVQGEKDAFSVVSSGKTCHILTDDSTPAAEALRLRRPTEAKVLTAVRTGRISDYFARTCRYNPYMGRLNYYLPVALLLSIITTGISVLMGASLLDQGITVFTATYLSCLPGAYLLAMSLPATLVNRILCRKGAAVIGTAAPEEYASEASHLIFLDGDTMMATERMDVTLRGDKNAPQWKAMGDVLFRLLNTPLAVEPVLRGEDIEHYRIDLTEQGEGYILLYLTDRETEQAVEVMAGTHDALVKRGVRLPKRIMEDNYKQTPESHVMYLAFNRHFHMAYASEYRVGSSFDQVAEALTALNCRVSVASYDPMVDPDMKDLLYLHRHTEVNVVRPSSHESVRKSRSAGLVATSRATDLLHPFAACHRMRGAYRLSHLLGWLGMLAGFGMTALLIALGWEALLSSAYVVLGQLLSSLLLSVVCLWAVRPKALFLSARKKSITDLPDPTLESNSHDNSTK